jgi:putative inorganic carbon (HCO3(-)) transporter
VEVRGRTSPGSLKAVPAAGLGHGRERLAFNFGKGTVPTRAAVEAAIASEREPTFATAPHAEPRDWGYLGLLSFTVVMLVRPQDTVHGLEPLHLAEICAIVGVAPMLLHRFARRLPVFRVTPETFGLLLFGAVILVGVPFSVWPSGALELFTDSYLKVLVVFVLMMNTLTAPKRLEQLTWVIVLCCGYIAARSVFDYARGINLVEGDRLAGPVSGLFGNPNDLALNMVTFLPVPIVVALTRRHSLSKRVIAIGIVLLMIATIAFTKSRSGFIGFGVMVATLVLLGRHVGRGFGVVFLVGLFVAAPLVPERFWERMSTIADPKRDKEEFTGSRQARSDLLEEGIAAFKSHPLVGVGAGQFKAYNPPGRRQPWREAHNAIVQVAAETGIVGLLAFVFLIVRAIIATIKTRSMLGGTGPRGSPDPLRHVLSDTDRAILHSQTVAMTAGLMGWLACALFASVAFNWTFYYALALAVAARELIQHRLVTAHALLSQSGKNSSAARGRKLRGLRARTA